MPVADHAAGILTLIAFVIAAIYNSDPQQPPAVPAPTAPGATSTDVKSELSSAEGLVVAGLIIFAVMAIAILLERMENFFCGADDG